MKEIINHAIDWTSVKLCGISILGFIAGSEILKIFSFAAVISTMIYNGIRIYKEIKK